MIKENIEGQGAAERIEHITTINRQIEDITIKFSALPQLQSLKIAAGEARSRLESFIYLNGGDESEVPENKQGQLRELKEDVEETANIAKTAAEQYDQLTSELTRLKKERADLQCLNQTKDFSVEGLRDYVLGAVRPWMKIIEATRAKLDSLEAKRSKIMAELNNIKCRSKSLDEDALLEISVEDHMSELDSIQQLKNKKRAVEDLLQQTETAIEQKRKQLKSDQKEFADALTIAADEYTHSGILKFTQSFKRLFEEDKKYDKAMMELCSDLAFAVGAKPVDIFGFTGGTLPIQSHLICRQDIRMRIGCMIEDIFKQQAEQTKS